MYFLTTTWHLDLRCVPGHTTREIPPLADFSILLYLVFRGSY
jgi:hypothetical protein